jgi:hypothetical protein
VQASLLPVLNLIGSTVRFDSSYHLKEACDALVTVGLNEKITVVGLVYFIDEITE